MMNVYEKKFLQMVDEETNGEYKVLGRYVRSSEKLLMKHVKCGLEYTVRPNDFQQGRRCPECANVGRRTKRRKSNEQFLREVKEQVGNEYTFLDEYVNYFTELRVVHNECGHVYKVLPSNFLHHKQRCPSDKCLRKRKSASQAWTTSQFKEKVKEQAGSKYTVLGEYENSVTPIKIRHNKCGFVYSVTPGNFLHHKKRCPKCQYSRGEKRVKDFLLKNNVTFKAQYKFSDCRLVLPLPFDFVTFDKSGNVTHAIEYDGEFHFYQKFRTDEEFAKQQKRDKIKNEYCKENGITLIRIPYTQLGNIEKILRNRLLLARQS